MYRHSRILWEGLGQSYKWKKFWTRKQACVERERNWSLGWNCPKENRRVRDYELFKSYKCRSINFNWQSTNKLPTDYQHSADMLPTVGCLSTDRSLKLWKKLSADSRWRWAVLHNYPKLKTSFLWLSYQSKDLSEWISVDWVSVEIQ